MSWLDLGQGYELNTRLHLLDFSSVFLAADYAPARFDDREVGDGTALERAGYIGGKLEYDSDPRRAVYATIANQTQVMGAGDLRDQRAGERRLPRAPAARHRAHSARSPGRPASTATPGSRSAPTTPISSASWQLKT